MESFHVERLADGVHWVGVKDWNRRSFDALVPLPEGTSYNAYIVEGGKRALIDTTNPGFEEVLARNVNAVCGFDAIDYVVMNHAEPDHAGAIAYVLERCERAKLIATEKGAKMASMMYGVPEDRMVVVHTGDTLELGTKTLRFIEAPWVHWPETMLTYLEEDKILFPCDFFGCHTPRGMYDDEVEDIISLAKRYFGEIMMPFRKMTKKALESVMGLDVRMIAPSHGPIYRNPSRILDAYARWTEGYTKEKVIVVYVSMWGSTERMVDVMVDTLLSRGVQVCVYNLATADIGDVACELVDSRGIVLGTPTVLGGMHPVAFYGAHLTRVLRPPIEYGVMLSSYGWGGGAVRQASDVLSHTSIDVLGIIEVNGPPSDSDLTRVKELGELLADKVKGMA
ncbi:MAG: FprA family A-type flavoprotein [Methermicoccaceae archaeon]